MDPFTPAVDGAPHDPLDPSDLERLRVWLARQPESGRVSVYAALRLLATIDAERGLSVEPMGAERWMQLLADPEFPESDPDFSEEVDF